ncbi:histidine phosphatase family protein [Patescibacteria group bacterium]|nr:histidine phosphatase family protein [Patescibacteria group bacterium]
MENETRRRGMATTQYHCRHGEHTDNKLTPEGVAEVRKAAHWVAKEMKRQNIRSATLVSSEIPRAVETADWYEAVLTRMGLHVERLDPDSRLNPAGGIAAIMGNGGIPKYGDGLVAAWRELGDNVPEGCETFEAVGRRCAGAARTIAGPAVLVYHGGSIEPAVHELADVRLTDLPSAGVVEVATVCWKQAYDPNDLCEEEDLF